MARPGFLSMRCGACARLLSYGSYVPSGPCRSLPEGDSVQQGCEGCDGRRPRRLQL